MFRRQTMDAPFVRSSFTRSERDGGERGMHSKERAVVERGREGWGGAASVMVQLMRGRHLLKKEGGTAFASFLLLSL